VASAVRRRFSFLWHEGTWPSSWPYCSDSYNTRSHLVDLGIFFLTFSSGRGSGDPHRCGKYRRGRLQLPAKAGAQLTVVEFLASSDAQRLFRTRSRNSRLLSPPRPQTRQPFRLSSICAVRPQSRPTYQPHHVGTSVVQSPPTSGYPVLTRPFRERAPATQPL